jgi:hypothetical protein
VVTQAVRVPGRALATIAGVIALATTVLYLTLITSEEEADTGVVAIVTAVLVILGAAALAAGLVVAWTPRTRLIVLGATTGGLLAAGVLGIFSIGLPLIAAAVCCLFAWGRVASAVRPVPSGAPLLSAVAGVVTGAIAAAAILAA